MPFAPGDMRVHIVSHTNDHGASYGRDAALQWWSRLKTAFARFSASFNFRLLQHYPGQADIPPQGRDQHFGTQLDRRRERKASFKVVSIGGLIALQIPIYCL